MGRAVSAGAAVATPSTEPAIAGRAPIPGAAARAAVAALAAGEADRGAARVGAVGADTSRTARPAASCRTEDASVAARPGVSADTAVAAVAAGTGGRDAGAARPACPTIATEGTGAVPAEQWVEELLSGALKAMADAGVEVSRGPLRIVDDKIFVEIDGADLMARDPVHDHPSLAVEVILGRLDSIAAQRESRARWHFWYTGDPVGAGFFVTPEELITSAGIDVRELETSEKWYRPDPQWWQQST